MLSDHGLLDLTKVLSDNHIDILVCDGITRGERDFISARRVQIIENVVGTIDELLNALDSGILRPGFGLGAKGAVSLTQQVIPSTSPQHDQIELSGSPPAADIGTIDCLACRNKVCLKGERCDAVSGLTSITAADGETSRMLEASLDIACEEERTLCRLSELIYFCLEMRYQRLGVAYCVDLQEPAEVLVRVLRRFFKVYPVCCKIGGVAAENSTGLPKEALQWDPDVSIACNPEGQAEALNRLDTDLNIIVGICMGSDCVFSMLSNAPVTTLFVKDRSLANNPIGAVYSDFYLKEAIQPHHAAAARNRHNEK